MSVRFAAMCAVAAFVIPSVGQAQSDTSDAVRNWGAIKECGGISDADRRLGCMDDVLRRAGIGSAAAGPASAPRAAAPEPARPAQVAAAPAAPAPSTPAATPAPAASSAPATSAAQSRTTTIASVKSAGFNRYLVTAADGSAWEQTEGENFLTLPKAGDTFTVEPGALGGFRCRFNRSSVYRCRQAD